MDPADELGGGAGQRQPDGIKDSNAGRRGSNPLMEVYRWGMWLVISRSASFRSWMIPSCPFCCAASPAPEQRGRGVRSPSSRKVRSWSRLVQQSLRICVNPAPYRFNAGSIHDQRLRQIDRQTNFHRGKVWRRPAVQGFHRSGRCRRLQPAAPRAHDDDCSEHFPERRRVFR
jgi:hypothetical protein